MSRNGKSDPARAGGWLEGDQQRAWLAYIRVQLRLSYEMNRQLLADSGISLPDYDVLTALSVADGGADADHGPCRPDRLGAEPGVAPCAADERQRPGDMRRFRRRRRVTEVTLTARGRHVLEEAAPGHVELVRRLFFGGLADALVGPLREALESVYANIISQGSLPPPVGWHPAEGLTRQPASKTEAQDRSRPNMAYPPTGLRALVAFT